MRPLHLLLPLLALAGGCGPSTGGSASGALADAVGAGTAPYAKLDLASGTVTYHRTVDDLAANPAYRDAVMVFRLVGPAGARSYVGVFELTQAQWQRIGFQVPDGGAPPVDVWQWELIPTTVVAASARSAAHPAFNLPYDDLVVAVAGYAPAGSARLAIPSAAQWQHAAGTASGYAWGAEATRSALTAHALVRETALDAANAATRLAPGTLIDTGGPEAVGTRAATSTGVCDIHGNVWEWIAGGTEVRGGSWFDAASLARAEVAAGAGQGLASDVDHALIGARLVLLP